MPNLCLGTHIHFLEVMKLEQMKKRGMFWVKTTNMTNDMTEIHTSNAINILSAIAASSAPNSNQTDYADQTSHSTNKPPPLAQPA